MKEVIQNIRKKIRDYKYFRNVDKLDSKSGINLDAARMHANDPKLLDIARTTFYLTGAKEEQLEKIKLLTKGLSDSQKRAVIMLQEREVDMLNEAAKELRKLKKLNRRQPKSKDS